MRRFCRLSLPTHHGQETEDQQTPVWPDFAELDAEPANQPVAAAEPECTALVPALQPEQKPQEQTLEEFLAAMFGDEVNDGEPDLHLRLYP